MIQAILRYEDVKTTQRSYIKMVPSMVTEAMDGAYFFRPPARWRLTPASRICGVIWIIAPLGARPRATPPSPGASRLAVDAQLGTVDRFELDHVLFIDSILRRTGTLRHSNTSVTANHYIKPNLDVSAGMRELGEKMAVRNRQAAIRQQFRPAVAAPKPVILTFLKGLGWSRRSDLNR